MPSLPRKTVYLVSPDSAKIEGLELAWENLKIITNKSTPYLRKAQKRGVNITFVKLPKVKKTSELLESPLVENLLKRGSRILVFKNLPKVEKLAKTKGWKILMPEAHFVNEIEDKIHFVKFCEKHQLPLLPTRVMELNTLIFTQPVVIQTRRGHAGESTFFVRSKLELEKLKRLIGKWVVKITPLMKLPTFSLDLVIGEKQTYQTQSFYQITGDARLNPLPGGTGGIDLGIAQKLKPEILKGIAALGEKVGEALRGIGYRGIAGIDLLVDERSGKLYLIECNPRMLSNLGFITKLQKAAGELPLLTIHILTMLEEKVGEYSPPKISQVKEGRFELKHESMKHRINLR
jgi:hypothetical protein